MIVVADQIHGTRISWPGANPLSKGAGSDRAIFCMIGMRLFSWHTTGVSMRVCFSFMLLLLAIASPIAFAQTSRGIEIGATLSEKTLRGLSGSSRKLSEYRGKPLIISVWASWCDPCRQEMGSLQRLSRRAEGKEFAIIGISTDDDPDAAKAFLQKSKITFHNFIDTQLSMENMLGADRLPLTLLVDAHGKVLAKFYGAREWDSPGSLEMIGDTFHIHL